MALSLYSKPVLGCFRGMGSTVHPLSQQKNSWFWDPARPPPTYYYCRLRSAHWSSRNALRVSHNRCGARSTCCGAARPLMFKRDGRDAHCNSHNLYGIFADGGFCTIRPSLHPARPPSTPKCDGAHGRCGKMTVARVAGAHAIKRRNMRKQSSMCEYGGLE